MAKKLNYSFKNACGNVRYKDYRALNEELKTFLGCKTIQHYYKKRQHYIDIPARIKSGIEAIFSKYGINPSEVWEITEVDHGSTAETSSD